MGSQAVTPWHSNLSKLAMSSWSSSKENTSRLVACLSGLTDLGRGTNPFCRLHLIKTYMQELVKYKMLRCSLSIWTNIRYATMIGLQLHRACKVYFAK